MSTQKQKFELFRRLGELGFTYDESIALRRIEMTLQRWAELECGNDSGHIERDDRTGKPFRHLPGYHRGGNRGWQEGHVYAIADREAGALRRLAKIVRTRNDRVNPPIHVPSDPRGAVIQSNPATEGLVITPYLHGDCRGCMLYLLTRAQLTQDGKTLPIDQHYNRGLAVCA